MQKIAIWLIQAYRYFVSPLLGNVCRFYPCCSLYAKEAIKTRGLIFGFWLSLKRIVRCQPWCEGGYDPVNK